MSHKVGGKIVIRYQTFNPDLLGSPLLMLLVVAGNISYNNN